VFAVEKSSQVPANVMDTLISPLLFPLRGGVGDNELCK
jgi:hypothetical protein